MLVKILVLPLRDSEWRRKSFSQAGKIIKVFTFSSSFCLEVFSRNGITFWRCDFCSCMNYLHAKWANGQILHKSLNYFLGYGSCSKLIDKKKRLLNLLRRIMKHITNIASNQNLYFTYYLPIEHLNHQQNPVSCFYCFCLISLFSQYKTCWGKPNQNFIGIIVLIYIGNQVYTLRLQDFYYQVSTTNKSLLCSSWHIAMYSKSKHNM